MRHGLVMTAALAALTGAASAQDRSSDDGFYVRAGAGASFLGDLEQEFAYNPNFASIITPPSGALIESEAGFVASGAIGFDYTEGIRTELEYRYAVNDIQSTTAVGGFDPSGGPIALPPAASGDDVTAHFVFSNFYFDWINSSRFTPFIGAGVGGAFVTVGATSETDAALAYQGRAGVAYTFSEDFFVDVEYVYTRTNTLRYGPNPEDFTPTGPVAAAVDGDNYQSSSVIVSVRKHF